MAEKNVAGISFEKQIWNAACVLRGNMDASEYKNVVLGLIFLKYISDRFDEKYQELVAEGDGFEEDIDEYTSEGIFFVPTNARWNVIAANAHTPEIGTIIDDAMRAIEKENSRLKDILPKNFARPELDKRRLGDVVDLFTNIQMTDDGSEKDILGNTYQYCLRKFAENEGKLAGEFFTPECVVKSLVEVLQPYNGRVYDPCCGSGGMFVLSFFSFSFVALLREVANLLTVVAVVGCLPACKSLVSAIMYLKYKSCSQVAAEQIDAHIGQLHGLYDMVFTSYKINYFISHLVVHGNIICGYSEDKEFLEKTFLVHIEEILKLDGHKNYSIKIFTDLQKYTNRLDQLNELETENKYVNTVLETLKSVSL